MKILLLKNYVRNPITIRSGLELANKKLSTLGFNIEFVEKDINKQFTSIKQSSDVVNDGYFLNPKDYYPLWQVGYDAVLIVYEADLISPKPTNPATVGAFIQMPEFWYGGKVEVLCEFFLHELCHYFFAGSTNPDITHAYPSEFSQKPRTDYYLYLLSTLIPKTMPITQPLYKYFKPNEVIGLKPELVQMLDKARELAGTPFIINNGFRTPEQNKKIEGAAPNSPHMRGLAVDLRCDNTTRTKILKGLLNCGTPVFIEVAGKHLHVDIDGAVHPLGDTMWGNDPS